MKWLFLILSFIGIHFLSAEESLLGKLQRALGFEKVEEVQGDGSTLTINALAYNLALEHFPGKTIFEVVSKKTSDKDSNLNESEKKSVNRWLTQANDALKRGEIDLIRDPRIAIASCFIIASSEGLRESVRNLGQKEEMIPMLFKRDPQRMILEEELPLYLLGLEKVEANKNISFFIRGEDNSLLPISTEQSEGFKEVLKTAGKKIHFDPSTYSNLSENFKALYKKMPGEYQDIFKELIAFAPKAIPYMMHSVSYYGGNQAPEDVLRAGIDRGINLVATTKLSYFGPLSQDALSAVYNKPETISDVVKSVDQNFTSVDIGSAPTSDHVTSLDE